jgi:hypothetical protein
MSFYAGRFNLYLTMLLALALICGCASDKKKKDQPVGMIRIHVESQANLPDGGQTISVLRTEPLQVTISKIPILTEQNVIRVALLESPGGPSIEIKFDESGMWTLEQFTSANPGRHLAVFGQWSNDTKDGRWLAAPLITQRIGDGILAFTPDMSREEAKKFVIGLSATVKKIQAKK